MAMLWSYSGEVERSVVRARDELDVGDDARGFIQGWIDVLGIADIGDHDRPCLINKKPDAPMGRLVLDVVRIIQGSYSHVPAIFHFHCFTGEGHVTFLQGVFKEYAGGLR